MKKTILHYRAGIFLFLLAISFTSCWSTFRKKVEPEVEFLTIQPEAYVPVYGVDSFTRGIKRLAPQPTVSAGKIYVFGDLLFQVDNFKGVHVIDYSDRHNPVKLGFIACKGSTELAVKNGFLITNNLNDLVTIDFRDSADVKEVARIKGAFPHYSTTLFENMRPPGKEKYYVCPDIQKGDVIGWKLEKNVNGAYCYNN